MLNSPVVLTSFNATSPVEDFIFIEADLISTAPTLPVSPSMFISPSTLIFFIERSPVERLTVNDFVEIFSK